MPETPSRPRRKKNSAPAQDKALATVPRPPRRGGFYGPYYTSAETFELDEIDAGTLIEEIGMLRVIMRRVFEAAANEAAGLEDWQEALGMLSLAANRLANLLGANRKLTTASLQVGAVLSQALNEMVAEMKQAQAEGRL
jgi:hypothetical protein